MLDDVIIISIDNLLNEYLCLIQAQRLLAHFTLPSNPTAMPNITAGLPAQVSNDTLRGSLQNQYVNC